MLLYLTIFVLWEYLHLIACRLRGIHIIVIVGVGDSLRLFEIGV